MNIHELAARLLVTAASILIGGSVWADSVGVLDDDFSSADLRQWPAVSEHGEWVIRGGMLTRDQAEGGALCVAAVQPLRDTLFEAKLRTIGNGRQTFGLATRVGDGEHLLLRYYDKTRGIELLSLRAGSFQTLKRAELPYELQRDRWYRLKVATVDDAVLAKMWPDDAPEPKWQLSAKVGRTDAGKLAIVAHDDTRLQVDEVKAWSAHPSITAVRQTLAGEREAATALITKKLKLAAVAESAAINTEAGKRRRLRIVPHVQNDRHPIAGRLTVVGGDTSFTRDIALSDYIQQAYVVEIPEPPAAIDLRVSLDVGSGKPITTEVRLAPYERKPLRHYVQTCLDTLIEHGRDAYGATSSPLFMAVLDADTLTSPEKPETFGALIRLEGRLHRRGERGSNLWYDQALLRAFYRMAQITGEPRYAAAADDYIGYFFDHCRKGNDSREVYLNGMPAWGTHVFWDCFEDRPGGDGDGNGPHEVLVFDADWEAMYRVHPEGVKRAIEGIWQYHVVDKKTGLHNRHDDRTQGCDFAFSGSSFIKALAFMFSATDDPEYLRRAKIVAGWHWDNRNAQTGLTADCPGLTRRYDGHHCFTTVPGPHAIGLIGAYRLGGDAYFRDVATTYIKAYDKYGWDDEKQTYWAMLRLDGTPLPEQPKGSGYDAYAPYGVVDEWRTTIYSYEFTLAAGQAAMLAYETSVDDGAPDVQLLQVAQRWGQVIERALPVHTGRRWKKELVEALPAAAEVTGGYAEDYGRAISLFVHLYRATKDEHYLQLATQVANEATDKLFHNGVFVGHPAKPYYETTDGVGILLVALLELDSPNEPFGAAY